ncbi:MAG: flavin reductase [Candidatus Delongbacteria bacterium]|nr:flavin reductase [Candidatus Delongbacteria bacterium]
MDLTTLFKVTYGMYIVSSKKGEKINAQLSNTVVQISPDPATMLISVSKNNLTHEFIEESGIFTISIVSNKCEMKDIGHFGFRTGRDFDKFKNSEYVLGKNGAPYIREKMIGYVECEVIRTIDSDSHTIFIGIVTDAATLNTDLEPMTYDFYRKELHGKLSKNATHYQEEK